MLVVLFKRRPVDAARPVDSRPSVHVKKFATQRYVAPCTTTLAQAVAPRVSTCGSESLPKRRACPPNIRVAAAAPPEPVTSRDGGPSCPRRRLRRRAAPPTEPRRFGRGQATAAASENGGARHRFLCFGQCVRWHSAEQNQATLHRAQRRVARRPQRAQRWRGALRSRGGRAGRPARASAIHSGGSRCSVSKSGSGRGDSSGSMARAFATAAA
mmetsp:Transcript_5485/g.17325  ORF Transcript_5485/g.17325 Transcript_5485/m.17325 type:complete len:213 (-) Transcript_5485:55-693(-)